MKLLVAHDGSEHANKTLDEAVKLAGQLGGTGITVLIVVPDLCLLDIGADECRTITETLQREAEGFKEKIGNQLAAQQIATEVRVTPGSAEERILEVAEEIDADLIVIGAAGKHGGTGRSALGSVAQKVVNKSNRNVMVIR